MTARVGLPVDGLSNRGVAEAGVLRSAARPTLRGRPGIAAAAICERPAALGRLHRRRREAADADQRRGRLDRVAARRPRLLRRARHSAARARVHDAGPTDGAAGRDHQRGDRREVLSRTKIRSDARSSCAASATRRSPSSASPATCKHVRPRQRCRLGVLRIVDAVRRLEPDVAGLAVASTPRVRSTRVARPSLRSIDPERAAVEHVASMDSLLDDSFGPRRFNLYLLGGVRRRRAGAGRDRTVRRDGLPGVAAHARDRRTPRARRHARRRVPHDPRPRRRRSPRSAP